jgi:hypothetical protein
MWPRAKQATTRGMLLLYAAYVALLAVAVLRGGNGNGVTEVLTYAIVAAFALLLLPSARSDRERRDRLNAIALAPGVYALANMVLHLGGVKPPANASVSVAADMPSQLLSWVGVSATRTQFPLGTGINAFGVIAAIALTGAVVVWWLERGPIRWLAAACAVGALYCEAYSDTRGALFAAIGVLALLALFKRIKPIRWLVIVVPLSPFVVTWVIGHLSNTGLSGALSRNGNDFSTGTNRFAIWDGALKVLHHFDLQQLIGWGTAGQVKSGAALHYYWLFRNLPNPLQPTHNFMIQTVLDTGYLGLAITVVLFAGDRHPARGGAARAAELAGVGDPRDDAGHHARRADRGAADDDGRPGGARHDAVRDRVRCATRDAGRGRAGAGESAARTEAPAGVCAGSRCAR